MKKKGSTKKKNIKKKKKTTVNSHKSSRKKNTKFINKVQKKIKNVKQKNLSKKIENKEENARKKEERINVAVSKSSKLLLKIVIFIFAIILVVSISLLFFKKEDTSKLGFTKITFKEYIDSYKDEQLQFIYITSNNCTYCDLLEPYLSRLESEYNIEFKSLNISGLSNEKLNQINDSNSVFERDWKTPILISIKNGKEISNIRGYREYAVLRKFVEYSQNPTDSNSFINISINKYLNIIKSNELSVIYIGRSRSNSCKRFAPILEKVSTTKGFKVYYLNTDTLDTESDWEALKNSSKIFEGTWFMPATIIVKDNVIIDYEMQAMNEFDLIDFFDKNGI